MYSYSYSYSYTYVYTHIYIYIYIYIHTHKPNTKQTFLCCRTLPNATVKPRPNTPNTAPNTRSARAEHAFSRRWAQHRLAAEVEGRSVDAVVRHVGDRPRQVPNVVTYHTILYCTKLCYTVLYCTALYYYCTILRYSIVQFSIVQYGIVEYTSIVYHTLLAPAVDAILRGPVVAQDVPDLDGQPA